MDFGGYLDIAISIVLVYTLLSIICSAVAEIIEFWLKRRAVELEKGIANLLQDPEKLTEFYKHPLINSLYTGQYEKNTKIREKQSNFLDYAKSVFKNFENLRDYFRKKLLSTRLPSYIPAKNFAQAVIGIYSQYNLSLLADLTSKVDNANSARAGAVPQVLTDASQLAAFLKELPGHIATLKQYSFLSPAVDHAMATLNPLQRSLYSTDLSTLAELQGIVNILATGSPLTPAQKAAHANYLAATQINGMPTHADVKTALDSILPFLGTAGTLSTIESRRTADGTTEEQQLLQSVLDYTYRFNSFNTITIPAMLAVLPNSDLKTALTSIYTTTGDSIEDFRKGIEDWYDSSMDRVAGWYKRHLQIVLFFLGFGAAAMMNIDSINIFNVLKENPKLAESISKGLTAKEIGEIKTYIPMTATDLDKPAQQTKSEQKPAHADSPKTSNKTPSSPQTDNSTKLVTDLNTSISPGPPNGNQVPDATKQQETDKQKKVQAEFTSDQMKKYLQDVKTVTAKLNALGLPLGWQTEILFLKNISLFGRQPFGGLKVNLYNQAGVPILVKPYDPAEMNRWFWMKLLGLILTGIAVTFGAPFWFDVLNRLIIIRSTVKPKESSPPEKGQNEPKKS